MNMNFKTAIDQFRKYTEVTKTKGTNDYYRFYLEALSHELGHLDCDEITNIVIVDYIHSIKNLNPAISNATLNKYIMTIKTVVKVATDRVITFHKLKERVKIIPTISKDSQIRVYSYLQKNMGNCFSFRNYVYLRLMNDTGLRMNEMNHLRIRDIDFDTASIHVKVTKTNVDRYVCFTDSTSQLLIKYIITQNIKDYLFIDFRTGKILTTSSVESFIYRLKRKLDIQENITPHKWRHTFATGFLRKGGDLETLRLLLGHSNLKTTQKYLHLSKIDIVDKYREIMEKR